MKKTEKRDLLLIAQIYLEAVLHRGTDEQKEKASELLTQTTRQLMNLWDLNYGYCLLSTCGVDTQKILNEIEIIKDELGL